MTEEELKLLQRVATKCYDEPEFLTHIINAGVSGIGNKEKEMRVMASDMETMASAMCFLVGQNRVSSKLKEQMSNLALSKLGKYYKKSFLRWDDQVKKEGD